MIRNLADTLPITPLLFLEAATRAATCWVQTHLELFASKIIPAFADL
jgi:hypothetical protein